MKEQLLYHYTNTPILKHPPIRKVNTSCVNGMFIEILGGAETRYNLKFINKKTGVVSYETEINRNCWARSNVRYYVDWQIELLDKQTNTKEKYDLNLHNKRVYVSLESKSLGDTLAWIPYVEEFRKKHNCVMICSTFLNDIFKSEYPEITFIEPGTTAYNLAAMYSIGLFYMEDGSINYNLHPSNPLKVPLQQIASDILGLDYVEIRPRIRGANRNIDKSKQVCIAVHSTTQAKYWNNPTGWQEVVDWLTDKGYVVKLLSHEGDNYMGNTIPKGVLKHPSGTIDTVIEELKKSEMFIGLGSGLSWLSWGLEIPTMLISGFSYDWAEMKDCIRIGAPEGKCGGCFNRVRLDAGDWNWCPDHKGTVRQFECTKLITGNMVIQELETFFSRRNSNLPRIQVKHLLTSPEDYREQLSIESIKQLQKYGIDYEQVINEVYVDYPPVDNCRRPDHISKDNKPGELYPGTGVGWITGRHYGCYLAHRSALETIDENNYDYTLIFEADAYICTNINEFVKVIHNACDISEKNDVYYISFANNESIEYTRVNELFTKTGHTQTLAHCYLIPNRNKQWWLDRIIDCEWDVADLWYNHVFYKHPQLRYTTSKVYSKQANGYSLLDETVKNWD